MTATLSFGYQLPVLSPSWIWLVSETRMNSKIKQSSNEFLLLLRTGEADQMEDYQVMVLLTTVTVQRSLGTWAWMLKDSLIEEEVYGLVRISS